MEMKLDMISATITSVPAVFHEPGLPDIAKIAT
jgi:hypothetical protein